MMILKTEHAPIRSTRLKEMTGARHGEIAGFQSKAATAIPPFSGSRHAPRWSSPSHEAHWDLKFSDIIQIGVLHLV